MILIGSRALSYWCPDFQCRPDADWDIVMNESDRYLFNDTHKIDYHWYSQLNNGVMAQYEQNWETVFISGFAVKVAPLEWLAAIKRSHLWRDYFFDKHIAMYHRHLEPWFDRSEFYHERVALTKKAYPQGNPSLNQSNEDFFEDAVNKVYDHDHIHELAAHYDRPLYTKLKRDDSKAWCEADLWACLPDGDKIKCVQEEAYVIATERFLVPSDWKHSYGEAYIKAVRKICTTLTSGWFRDFAIDHYPQIVQQFDIQKLHHIKKELTHVEATA